MPDLDRNVVKGNREIIVKTSREHTEVRSDGKSRGKKRKRYHDSSTKNGTEQSMDIPSTGESSNILGKRSTEKSIKSQIRHGSPRPIVTDMRSTPKPNSSYGSLKQKSEALLKFKKELPIWTS